MVRPESPRPRRSVWRWLRLVVSLALLGWVAALAEWAEVLNALRSARALELSAFVALMPLAVWLRVVKWKLLLDDEGARVGASRLYGLFVVGQFYNHVLPSSVGGDVVRGAILAREVPSGKTVAGSIVVERLTGITALVLFAVTALLLTPALWGQRLLVALTAVSVAGYGGLLMAIADQRFIGLMRLLFGRFAALGRLLDKLERFRVHLSNYRRRPGVLIVCLGLSALFYASSILGAWLAARGIGYAIAPADVAAVMPLAQLISMLPVALNGVGLTEWVFAATLETLGPGATAGLMVALLVRFRNALWAAGGYAVWLAFGAPSGTADRGEEAAR